MRRAIIALSVLALICSPGLAIAQEVQSPLFPLILALQPTKYRSAFAGARFRNNHLTVLVNEHWQFIPYRLKQEFVRTATRVWLKASKQRGSAEHESDIQVSVINLENKLLATWDHQNRVTIL
jgi:hypothetical protein